MNRKLKYRIWDNDEKRWVHDDDEVIGINNYGVMVDDRDDMNDLSSYDGVTVQLFTGATDKNNKEIYDGDILNYKGRIGRVEYFATMYICSWNDQTDDALSHMIIGDIEVIGNVFENPELLNSVPTTAVEDEEEENEDLSSCENCGEHGWDGRICHICGAKHI